MMMNIPTPYLNHSSSNLTWPKTLVKAFSALIILIGAFFLIAWPIYFWLPTALTLYLYTVEPNVAVCTFLCGITLWIRNENTSSYANYLADMCAGIVFLISFLTLFQYFFSINLGIDQALFKEPLQLAGYGPLSGRMSPFSAANFVLISFVLFFLDNKVVNYQTHQILTLIVIFSAFFSFLIHFYRVNNLAEFLGIDRYSQMSLIIILIFLLLGIGVIFARPHRGIAHLFISKDSGGTLARHPIPPAIILPIILGYIGLIGLGNVYYEAVLGISLLVMGIVIFFIAFILLNAYLVEKTDIKRKAMEQILKLEQAQLQAILDNTSAMIYIYDLQGRYLLINKELERLAHKSAAEIIGQTTHDIFEPEVADQLVD